MVSIIHLLEVFPIITQEKFECNCRKKEKLKQIIGYDKIKDEEYIEKLCLEIGLSEKYSETIFLYWNNTAEETASILEIDVKTVRRRIDKFIEKAI